MDNVVIFPREHYPLYPWWRFDMGAARTPLVLAWIRWIRLTWLRCAPF